MAKKIKGETEFAQAKKKPRLERVPVLRDVDFDLEHAFALPIGEETATFVPAVGLFGTEAKKAKREGSPHLFRKPATIGVIINCEGAQWTVESEPTGTRSLGIIVYNEARKPIMIGQGSVPEDEDTAIVFSLRTVYDWVQSSPKGQKVTVGGECKTDGTCTGKVGYEISW